MLVGCIIENTNNKNEVRLMAVFHLVWLSENKDFKALTAEDIIKAYSIVFSVFYFGAEK